MDEIEEALSGLDAPRQLPDDIRARLGGHLVDREPLLDGIDDPRPLPRETRDRLLEGLTLRRRRSLMWLNIAAVVLLVAAIATVVVRTSGGGGPGSRVLTGLGAGAPATIPPSAAPSGGANAGVNANASSGTEASGSFAGTGAGALTGAAGNAAGGSAGGAAAPTPAFPGPPPPYAFSSPGVASEPSSGASTPPPSLPPLRIGIVVGDPVSERAFRGYVQTLNADGGVRGRQLDVVTVSPSAPARGVVATVNLSDAPVATTSGPPPWASAPLLETLTVPEGVLQGGVFDLSSAPVHQARLAVTAVFPSPSPGSTAVVFTERSGVLATDVPNAMLAALQAVHVTPIVVPYMSGETFPRADAAFLSLDTATARSWLADASQANYRPRLGVTGLYSIAEPSLLPAMPAGTRMLAPYDLPNNEERLALAQAVGASPGMAAVQGWVTAKALAVALWQSGATTAAQAMTALAGLRGYNDGFSPALAFRQSTNSRLPDAELMTVSGAALVPSGQFRTDPVSR